MPQFDVFENQNPDTSDLIPYVLDIQSDLLSHLNTRVVVPLVLTSELQGQAAERLHPLFRIQGNSVMMLTHHLAAVLGSEIGSKVASLARARDEIIGAVDLLITGI